ncbi:hypothetical protein [Streptomyces sp. NPDC047970]|uniref:hypothetical protein n=1 Tax=unclassified Streptomyces TaxID=2593676 RepID=UPI00342AA4D3
MSHYTLSQAVPLLGVNPDTARRSADASAQNGAWTEALRYTGRVLLAKARLHSTETGTDETVLPTKLAA